MSSGFNQNSYMPRHKREDLCLECNRAYARSDPAFQKYNLSPLCWTRNIMVCKSCTLEESENVTFYTKEGVFDVWCLDKGLPITMNSIVECLMPLVKAQSASSLHAQSECRQRHTACRRAQSMIMSHCSFLKDLMCIWLAQTIYDM